MTDNYERTAGVIADCHIPYQDDKAYYAALEYIKDRNPNELIILGDFLDMHKLSFWKDKPVKMTFPEEVELGKEKLTEIRKEFPDAKITFVKGNHCNRLDRYLMSKSAELFGLDGLTLSRLLDMRNLKVNYVDNIEQMTRGHQPLSVGGVTMIHSEELGRVGFSGVNLARTYLMRALCNVMAAHHHQTQSYKLRTLEGGELRSWLVGCLCNLNQSYMPHSNHNHGLAMVYWNSKARPYKPYVRNLEIVDGKVKE